MDVASESFERELTRKLQGEITFFRARKFRKALQTINIEVPQATGTMDNVPAPEQPAMAPPLRVQAAGITITVPRPNEPINLADVDAFLYHFAAVVRAIFPVSNRSC